MNPGGSQIAYHEGKIFSVLPNDGSGDFTFRGGDGGTRVSQDGYIERTPHNFLTYSENVVTYWTKENITATANTIAGPFGRLTTSVVETTATGAHRIYKSNTFTGNKTTFTMYLKKYPTNAADHRIWIEIWNSTQGILNQTKFDLVSGTVSQNTGTANARYVGDGWWELNCFTTDDVLYTTNYLIFSGNDASRDPAGSTSEGFYFAGAQVTEGYIVRPYQKTTDRLNYPNVSYEDGVGTIVHEPERANGLTYSQDFGNTAWYEGVSSMVTRTGSAAISPDGTENAWRINNTSGNNLHSINHSFSQTSNRSYIATVYAKRETLGRINFLTVSIGASRLYASFDLRTGEVTQLSANGTDFEEPYAYIKEYKNGWWRLGVMGNALTTSGGYMRLTLNTTSGGGPNTTYTGVAGEGIYLWGAQVESFPTTDCKPFPTSYIPTTSAVVTRPRSYSYALTSALSNGGTWYINFANQGTDNFDSEVNGTNLPSIYLSGNTNYYPDSIGISRGSAGSWGGRVWDNSAVSSFTTPNTASIGPKLAMAFSGSAIDVYSNGNSVYSTTSFPRNTKAYDTITFGYDSSRPTKINFVTSAVFDSKLPNSQLAELTTLRSGSGGTISYNGPYTIHTFTSSGTFTPSFNGEVEVLVVAGGGGGGGAESNPNGGGGGGGGAGGLVHVTSYGVSSGVAVGVDIGAGGAGGTNNSDNATNGGDSGFGGIIAYGGGKGRGDEVESGGEGGSGGGAGGDSGVAGAAGIAGQGNKGGDDLSSSRSGGGGGGAGEAGENATDISGVMNGTAGGDGLPISITGISTYYAGGGGGGGSHNFSGTVPNSGIGGLGGGGNSIGLINGSLTYNFTGTVNSGGGGGGGANSTTAGNGGSGIVIVRYLT